MVVISGPEATAGSILILLKSSGMQVPVSDEASVDASIETPTAMPVDAQTDKSPALFVKNEYINTAICSDSGVF